MSEKHLKHIGNLILAGMYQFIEYVGISITMMLVKLRNSYCHEIAFLVQNVGQNAYLHL